MCTSLKLQQHARQRGTDILALIPDPKLLPFAGRIEYFYARNGAWQVSRGDSETYYFRNGQKEMHLGTGLKQVVYPDGTCYIIQDGVETLADIAVISAALKESIPSIFLGE